MTPALLLLLASTQVTINVDPNRSWQTIDGFGATFTTSVQAGEDTLTPAQKATAGEILFNVLRVNLGNVDNHTLSREFTSSAALIRGLYPGKISIRWARPELGKLRDADYEQYLDTVAATIVGWVKQWEKTWGFPPHYVMPFNEPTSGNKELARPRGPAADREMADILKRSGRSLREAGYTDVKFVFPNQETIDFTRQTLENVLADPEARQYIGRIGYHEYPYGSEMTSVKRVLERADRGEHGTVAPRIALRKLADKYGIPLWMSEVARGEWGFKSNGIEADCRDFRFVRGRANHIQSEFLIARASAFFGMNAFWNRRAHELHFPKQSGEQMYIHEGDDLVLFDHKYDSWFLTGMAYAIGHYSRWITPGETVVLESASSHPLVAVTALRDNAAKRTVLVVINNDREPHAVEIKMRRAPGIPGGNWPPKDAVAEQSTERAYWQRVEIDGLAKLPPLSVTTISDRWPRRPALNAPVVTASAEGKTLRGSVEGEARSVYWTLVSGPAPAVIDNPSSLHTTVSGLEPGEYIFRLFVVGEDWRAGSATVRVTRGAR